MKLAVATKPIKISLLNGWGAGFSLHESQE
jgi:hypothetical protein